MNRSLIYTVHCMFYDENERNLGEQDHPHPPRVGDHVWLRPPGEVGFTAYLVTGVWWEYPMEGSFDHREGKHGGMVTIMCTEGQGPFT
jgi:hypothetical protein